MAHKPHPNPSHRNRHHITVCHRHPDTRTTTGLCAPCLRDRLSLLTPSTSSSFSSAPPPELRRCKTFSSNSNNNFARVSYEPRRRSCDVNNGNKSLSSLFVLDDDDNNGGHQVSSSLIESKNIGLGLGLGFSVPEVKEEDDNEAYDEEIDLGFVESNEESKTMKEFIDLEFQSQTSKPSGGSKKDLKEMVGSVYKKLRKWRKKQGFASKRADSSVERTVGLGEMRLENLRGRRLRDTQSEVGEFGGGGRRSCDVDVDFRARVSIDYGRASIDCGALGLGFSRASCDSDPRFSIDLGHGGSIDEGRCSFDAPRPSWDGYLVGRRGTLPPPCGSGGPVVSVIENAMATVYGFDHGDNKSYSTKGFDGSSSIKEGVGVNETKLLITEKELNEWRLNSAKDDNSSESFESASKDLASSSSSSNGNYFKECRRWRKLWGLWGFLHRKKGKQWCNEEKVNTSRNGSKETRVDPDRKFVRSHSTTSSRGSSPTFIGSKPESNALVRNRSCNLSPNHFDRGLLRFYLTPLRSRRRSRLGESRLKNPPSLARNMVR